jgi:hypothetical protein
MPIVAGNPRPKQAAPAFWWTKTTAENAAWRMNLDSITFGKSVQQAMITFAGALSFSYPAGTLRASPVSKQ